GQALAEEKLLESLRAGHEEAFRELVREYQPSLVRVARIYVSNQAAAEDVAAETWLGVLKGLDRFEGRSSLRTWIFRILTNIAKTRAVRDGRTLPFSALQEPGRVPEAAVDADRFLDPEHPRWPGHWAAKPQAWPEDALLAAETRERLAEAIEALPATQRAVRVAHRPLRGLPDVPGADPADDCRPRPSTRGCASPGGRARAARHLPRLALRLSRAARSARRAGRAEPRAVRPLPRLRRWRP